MKQNMSISIPGQPNPIKQDMTMGQEYGLTVVKVRALPRQRQPPNQEMEFLNARVGMTMGGKTMLDYDSTKKSTDKATKSVGDIFSKIVGAKIQFFLSPSNEVDRMQGVEELTQRPASASKDPQLGYLKGMYGEGHLQADDEPLQIPAQSSRPARRYLARRV